MVKDEGRIVSKSKEDERERERESTWVKIGSRLRARDEAITV